MARRNRIAGGSQNIHFGFRKKYWGWWSCAPLLSTGLHRKKCRPVAMTFSQKGIGLPSKITNFKPLLT